MAVTNITTGEEQDVEPTQALADQGFVPDKLNSDVLNPGQTEDFQTFEETPPANASTFETPELQATESETQQIGLEDELAGLTKGLLGESAFTATQEDKQGLSDLEATQTDLLSQFKAIQNEAKAIPLQIQQDATGRGITKGGLAPLQTARLRTNAIQALGVNSLLEASRGNIATAQDMVDRAVAQKYGPIREAIAVKTANLQRLIDSPRTSLQDKNRAQKQLDIQNAKQDEADRQKEDDTTIWNMAVQASQSGADATVSNAIRNAKSKEEALQIATEAGIFTSAEEKNMAMNGYTKLKPSDLQQGTDITEEDILRMPNGDIYKKPTGTAERDTQIVTAGGRSLLIDKQTGETIQDLGGAYKAGSGTGTTTGTFKFSSDDNGRMIAVGFKSSEISQIQSDINEFGIDAVTDGMSEEQSKTISDIARGVTPTQADAEDEPDKITEGKRKVMGEVNALISDNASVDEINEFIKLRGYTKEDFTDLLNDYTPTVKADSWWKFWK